MSIVLVLVGLIITTVPVCHGLGLPDQTIVRSFAPVGRWAGHWGIDIAAPVGSAVTPVGPGIVVFSGLVVRNVSVTVDHGGGLRSSYSYLATPLAVRGQRVTASTVVGTSSVHGGAASYHLSLRVGDQYIDPLSLRRCGRGYGDALYLDPHPATYPPARVRTLRRYLRSSPCGPSGRGERRHRAARHRSGAVGSRRRALAEGRDRRHRPTAPDGDGAPGRSRGCPIRGR